MMMPCVNNEEDEKYNNLRKITYAVWCDNARII